MLNLNFLNDIILHGAIVSLVSFVSVLILTPRLIKILTIKGEVVYKIITSPKDQEYQDQLGLRWRQE